MKSIVAALVLFSALGSSAQQTLKTDVNLVSVYFTVRDNKGKLLTNLTRDAFAVKEDGRSQTITHFAQHTDVPLNVGVLIDTSTSLARILNLEADAAASFFRTVMRPRDLGFVSRYASLMETLQVPTEDTDLLATKVQVITKNGKPDPPRSSSRPQTFPGGIGIPMPTPQMPHRTARLYDAVGSTVGKFLADEYGRKAIVIVALADDAGSESSLEDALKTLKQNDVIGYVLEVQHEQHGDDDDCDIMHIFRREPHNRIGRLAEETGGRVIKVEGFDKMQRAFAEVAEELHQQYSLGYEPTNSKWDGSFRRIKSRPEKASALAPAMVITLRNAKASA